MKASSCSSMLSSALPSSTAGAVETCPVDSYMFDATSATSSIVGLIRASSTSCSYEMHPQHCTSGQPASEKTGKGGIVLSSDQNRKAQIHALMGGGLTRGASGSSSSRVLGASLMKVAEGARRMTARVLNSSKMRSRSSELCSSEKWEMAGSGDPATRSASLTLCCSSLHAASTHTLHAPSAHL